MSTNPKMHALRGAVLTSQSELITNSLMNRVFWAQARLLLAQLVWQFDLEFADSTETNWLKQKAFLVFEPKPLRVRITDRDIAGLASSDRM